MKKSILNRTHTSTSFSISETMELVNLAKIRAWLLFSWKIDQQNTIHVFEVHFLFHKQNTSKSTFAMYTTTYLHSDVTV